jgi:hypothetical protein
MSDNRDLLEWLADLDPVPEKSVAGAVHSTEARELLERIHALEPDASPTSRVKRRYAWRRLSAVAAALLVGILIWQSIGGENGQRAASASDVLKRAAVVAFSQTAETGDVEYTKTLERSLITYGIGPDGYSVVATEAKEMWVAPDGSGFVRNVAQPDVFPGPTERVAWEAAGSPDLGRPGTRAHTFDAGQLHYTKLNAYPIDPTALEQALQDHVHKAPPPNSVQMLSLIGDLLAEPGASPALQAALYRVAAQLPGVELLGDVTDDAGRPGTAVGIEYTDGGVKQRDTLIIDPHTSALLERSNVLLERIPNLDAEPPFVLDAEVFLDQGLVDSGPRAAS